jgi:tetratricopeptide (TPR) repeat protein
MNKWEYLKIHIMLEQGIILFYKAKRLLKEDDVTDYITSLGKEGWELVNVVEEIGNERVENKESKAIAGLFDLAIAGPRVTAQNQHKAVTLGYYLWFKRLFEPKLCNKCKTENNASDMFCKQCGELIGGNPSASDYFNRGNQLLDGDQLVDAIKEYSKSIQLKIDYVDAYRRRGVAYKLNHELDEAINDFNKAIDFQPNDASTYYNRATVWRKKGENRPAVLDFQKYLDLGGGVRHGDQSKVEDIIKELKKKH